MHGDEKLFANASNSPSCENHPMEFGGSAGSWLHDRLRARNRISWIFGCYSILPDLKVKGGQRYSEYTNAVQKSPFCQGSDEMTK